MTFYLTWNSYHWRTREEQLHLAQTKRIGAPCHLVEELEEGRGTRLPVTALVEEWVSVAHFGYVH